MSMKNIMRMFILDEAEDQREEFQCYGITGSRYSEKQIEFAVNKCQEIGVRATSRLLCLHRKTLQRWLRKHDIDVKRCPDWVYDWAYWRNKRREKWK